MEDRTRRRRPWAGTPRLVAHYFRFNLSAGMAYSTSFLVQVVGMAINNCAFIVFWIVLFDRVGDDIAGYGFADVMFLWALAATGVGIASVVFGNTPRLSRIVYTGELDVYLLQPKPVLPNVLVSRMMIAGWGDLLYGIVLFALTQEITLGGTLLFLLFSVLVALIATAVRVLYHCLTFVLGNAEGFAELAGELVLSFMLYPGSIFRGPTAWILHSLIPAALVAYIPAELFVEFRWSTFLVVLAADAAIVALALIAFRLGLRRYESGNLIGTRM